MSAIARTFESFAEGLRVSYEEEVSGEAFFAELAEHQTPANRHILLIFADMEQITSTSIKYLLKKHNIDVSSETELRRDGIAEARKVSSSDWAFLVASMIEDYPSYIEEFRSLKRLAPVADRNAINVLIEHEQAMLDFAILHEQGASDSTEPLVQFVTRHRRS